MFTLKLNDPKLLNSSLSILSDFITEATFSISKEGLRLIAMDPANISMVIFNILPSAFTEYSVDSASEITMNLEGLRQALRRAHAAETVTLTQEDNRMKIIIAGKSTKQFFVPLLEREGPERKAPELEFVANIELDANEFKDYIEDAAIVGEAVTFDASAERFALSAGETGRKVNIELKKGSDALVSLEVKENVASIYSVEYLKKMAKSAVLADSVAVQFGRDYPLRLDFKAIDKAQMSFILAPRIENR